MIVIPESEFDKIILKKRSRFSGFIGNNIFVLYRKTINHSDPRHKIKDTIISPSFRHSNSMFYSIDFR